MLNPFIADNWFKANPGKVLGEQVTAVGQHGRQIIKIKGGSLEGISCPVVAKTIHAAPVNVTTLPIGQIVQQVQANFKKKNTVKPANPDYYTFREIYNQYNSDISREELEAYLHTHPYLPWKKWIDKFTLSEEDLIEQSLVFVTGLPVTKSGSPKLEYRYSYLSGNVIQKLHTLQDKHKDYITATYGDSVYNAQVAALQQVLPVRKQIGEAGDSEELSKERLVLLPHSNISKEFKIHEILEQAVARDAGGKSLLDFFKEWLHVIPQSDFELSQADEVIKYYLENTSKAVSRTIEDPNNPGFQIKRSKEDIDKDERLAVYLKQRVKQDGDRLFTRFIREQLLPTDKDLLEYVWNEKFNGLVELNLNKIPVAFSFGNRFKRVSYGLDMPILTDPQRSGVAFLAEKKSGINAFDVGGGKTLTLAAHMSYAIDNNLARFPLAGMPNAVYEKTAHELQGYDEQENGQTVHYSGVLEFLPKIRHLYNLNAELVRRTLKTYSAQDEQVMNDLKEELGRLTVDMRTAKATKVLPARLDDNSYPYWNLLHHPEDGWVVQIEKELDKQEIAILKKRDTRQQKEGRVKSFLNAQGFAPDKTSSRYPEYEAWLKEFHAETTRLLDVNKNAFAVKVVERVRKHVNALYEHAVFTRGKFKPVPPGTISMITEEGLEKLGVRNNQDLIEELYEIMEQGEQYTKEKEAAGLLRTIQSRVGSVLYGSKIYIEDLGIDYFWLDEAHSAKKIITRLKGEPKPAQPVTASGQTSKYISRDKPYYDLKYGDPSNFAISIFALARHIQRTYKRNVVLTTATPFENSPLEVYSMLMLANYEFLIEQGFANMKDFFDTFMRIEWDLKITPKNDIVFGVVLNGYNNLPQLRTLVRYLIDHKTGDELKVERPQKITLPNDEIKTILRFTDEQQRMMTEVEDYMLTGGSLADICERAWKEEREETMAARKMLLSKAKTAAEREAILSGVMQEDPEEYLAMLNDDQMKEFLDKKFTEVSMQYDELSTADQLGVRLMQGLAMMRQIALSPYLFTCKKVLDLKPDYEQYVRTSPKLLYVMECIKSVREYNIAHKQHITGQVMYMNAGIDYFHLLKEYLVKEVGYAEHEVEMIGGRHNQSMTDRERVKDLYLKGIVKVMIGTKAILTGVDLQTYTSVMYNCYYDFNPTDAQQYEGRGWRRGNLNEFIRIVYPMLQNSADPILFQYMQEKLLRIKDIWDINGKKSQLDLKDFDPEKLKYDLITDPRKKAKISIIRDHYKLDTQLLQLKNQEEKVKEIKPVADDFFQKRDVVVAHLDPLIQHRLDQTDLPRVRGKFSDKRKALEYDNNQVQAQLNILLDDIKKEAAVKINVNAKDAAEKLKQKEARVKEQEKQKQTLEQNLVKNAKKQKENDEQEVLMVQKKKDAAKELQDILASQPVATTEIRDRNRVIYTLCDEFIEYLSGTASYPKSWSVHQDLFSFRSAYRNFYDMKRRIMDPIGLTDKDIPRAAQLYQKKMDDLQAEMDKLEATMPQRIADITHEINANAIYWRTPKEAAQEFAKLNYLLDQVRTPVIDVPHQEVPASAEPDEDPEAIAQEQRIRILQMQRKRKKVAQNKNEPK